MMSEYAGINRYPSTINNRRKKSAAKIKVLKIRLPSPIPESVLPKDGSALVVVVTDNGVTARSVLSHKWVLGVHFTS
jgi:hypothetical protein